MSAEFPNPEQPKNQPEYVIPETTVFPEVAETAELLSGDYLPSGPDEAGLRSDSVDPSFEGYSKFIKFIQGPSASEQLAVLRKNFEEAVLRREAQEEPPRLIVIDSRKTENYASRLSEILGGSTTFGTPDAETKAVIDRYIQQGLEAMRGQVENPGEA